MPTCRKPAERCQHADYAITNASGNGNRVESTANITGPRPTPELALLLACDLSGDAGLRAAVQTLSPGFDWGRFGHLAFGHDMAGIVGARLVPLAAGAMPADLADELTTMRRSEVAMSMTQLELTVRLTRALETAGIASIVLKGTALGHLLYAPCPEWRNSLDIDIAVAPEQRAMAEAVLLREGLIQSEPAGGVPLRGRDMHLLLQNAGDFIVPHSGQLVELHHRICRNPAWVNDPFEALLAQSIVLDTDHGPIRSLSGPVLLSYLCWHALAHMGYRLKWFCDLARALRWFGAPGCQAFASARGTSRHLALADSVLAHLLADIEGCPQPPASSRWNRRAAAIVADLEDPTDIPTRRSLAGLPAELSYRLFLARLAPGWRGKAFELLDLTSDPRDAALLGLGLRFAPVYAAAGPVLALCRMVQRRSA